MQSPQPEFTFRTDVDWAGCRRACKSTSSDGISIGKAIFDRQGIARVRHIDVNCLWLQEQWAKTIIPLNKIPGEDNTADLMTKHLAIAMILKHTAKLNLVHVGGRSEAAATLHVVGEFES